MFECEQSENEKMLRLKYTKGGAVDVKKMWNLRKRTDVRKQCFSLRKTYKKKMEREHSVCKNRWWERYSQKSERMHKMHQIQQSKPCPLIKGNKRELSWWRLFFSSTFHQNTAADDQDDPKEDQPCLWREEKRADGYRAENQQQKTDILGLLTYRKAFFFAAVMIHSHNSHLTLFYEIQ